MRTSFEAIKHALTHEALLHIADPNKGYCLRIDASNYAVGAVLE